MEYQSFGSTSLTISSIGFGGWAIGGPAMAGSTPIGWGEADDATSVQALRRAQECGITFYDTADFYGLGHSEELIGNTFGNSDRVVIATKVGHRLNSDGSLFLDYSKRHILAACEASLLRLKRDAIDLYQLHSARMVHLEQGECLAAMDQLQQEGKIRYWGLSLNTFAPDAEAEFMTSHNLGHGFQLVLNIVNQRALNVVKLARDNGYGVIVRMPLQFGLLTGKIARNASFPPNDHRSFRLTPEIISKTLDALAVLDPVREQLGISRTSFALSYPLSIEGVSTAIPGIRTPEHAEANTTGLVSLSEEIKNSIRQLSADRLDEVVGLMQKQG
jgi:aryl-alcohol dehydrogenase-like predicted oxidoreductase